LRSTDKFLVILAVSEATLKDANGKLLAFGTETCSIFPAANLAAR